MPTLVCAACRQPFEAEEGDEERALEEARKRYGKRAEELARVCADCFQTISRIEHSVRMARTARWN